MNEKLRSLNLDDLDVHELEHRLELSMVAGDAALYGCDTDCTDPCESLVTCCGKFTEPGETI